MIDPRADSRYVLRVLALCGVVVVAVVAVALVAELAVVARADAALKPPIQACSAIEPRLEAGR